MVENDDGPREGVLDGSCTLTQAYGTMLVLISRHDGDCDCGAYFVQRSGDGQPILRGEVRILRGSRKKSLSSPGHVLLHSPHRSASTCAECACRSMLTRLAVVGSRCI